MNEQKKEQNPIEYWVKLSKSGNGIILQDAEGKYLAFGNKETLEKLLQGEKKGFPLKKFSKQEPKTPGQ